MIKPTGIAILLASTLAFLPTVGMAGDRCKPEKVQGLTPEAIDRIVLEHVSRATLVPLNEIDVNLPLKKIDRSKGDVMTYSLFIVDISNDLGIDLLNASHDVAESMHAKNVGEAYEHTPVRILQSVVKSAFSATPNCDA